MPRTKEKPRSFASIIRGYFQDNPDWLQGPSNQALIERYEKDHPGERWSKKHQQGAANEKTKLRKKMGMVRRRRRRGRGAVAAADAGASRVMRVRTSMSALEQMELYLDDCVTLAVKQGNPALDGVIKHLRVARRGVAWAMGEPTSPRM